MWRGAKANGGQAIPGAAGRCGERRSAVRVIGASTPDAGQKNRCVDTFLIISIIIDKDRWGPPQRGS